MGPFKIEIRAVGFSGCAPKVPPGGRLFDRCKRLDCPDCLALDFVQMLQQKGISVGEATFTHHHGAVTAEVVDDLLTNTRRSGRF